MLPLTKDFEGDWDGSLDLNGNVLRLSLKLANQPGGGATGVLISIDQGGAQIPLRAIEQKGAHLKFTVPGVGGSYEGDVKDGQIVGTWTQGPGSSAAHVQARRRKVSTSRLSGFRARANPEP